MKRLTHASVFSGIGGPEVAATMLGWENLFHCEINPFGKAVLDYWYPNAKSYEDITKTDFTEWRGRVNVLTGGFPCQPFSYAGQRRGATDDRYLWPFMFRCIDQIRPDWVVAENVAGILTMVEQGEVSQVADAADLFGTPDPLHRYRLRETFTLQRICDDLESHGYSVQPVLIPACAVGAPHRRDRVFIIGHRNDATDTDRGRQSTPEQQGERERQTIQRESRVKSFNGTQRSCTSSPATDTAGSGARPSRENQGTKSSRRQDDQQPSQRREPTEWSYGFYEILRHATDPESLGQFDGNRQERPAVSGRPYMEEAERGINEIVSNGEQRTTADTDINRGCEMDEHMESKQPDGAEPFSDGRERNVADTDNARLERDGRKKLQGYQGGQRPGKHSPWSSEDGSGVCGERWQAFPSVSPVHRGNDGIPFPMDSLTLSAGKWRTEALKAYGNAIVPQVMYEIFRAIALTYEEE